MRGIMAWERVHAEQYVVGLKKFLEGTNTSWSAVFLYA